MTVLETRDINRKLKILRYGEELGNVSKACRYYGISRETYYQWKRAFAARGEAGLINSKPCPVNLKRRVPQPIEDQILYVRSTYHFGHKRIVWYISRYSDTSLTVSFLKSMHNNDLEVCYKGLALHFLFRSRS